MAGQRRRRARLKTGNPSRSANARELQHAVRRRCSQEPQPMRGLHRRRRRGQEPWTRQRTVRQRRPCLRPANATPQIRLSLAHRPPARWLSARNRRQGLAAVRCADKAPPLRRRRGRPTCSRRYLGQPAPGCRHRVPRIRGHRRRSDSRFRGRRHRVPRIRGLRRPRGSRSRGHRQRRHLSRAQTRRVTGLRTTGSRAPQETAATGGNANRCWRPGRLTDQTPDRSRSGRSGLGRRPFRRRASRRPYSICALRLRKPSFDQRCIASSVFVSIRSANGSPFRVIWNWAMAARLPPRSDVPRLRAHRERLAVEGFLRQQAPTQYVMLPGREFLDNDLADMVACNEHLVLGDLV